MCNEFLPPALHAYSQQARKQPMARFNQATAPRMRGVIASSNASLKELGQELLDKSCVGDVAAISEGKWEERPDGSLGTMARKRAIRGHPRL